ncbi:MAG: DUF3078 domain-containing protein, partial [Prolixibacteraceae bacterium]|nr:DUF3078 domain-containing protein [Prolixibacteraceae bacterium]
MCIKFLWIGIFILSIVSLSNASENDTIQVSNKDSIQEEINYLKYFVTGQGNWYSQNSSLKKDLSGLLHYVDDEKIDTILTHLGKLSEYDNYYFFRFPEDVSDSLDVPGYISDKEIHEIIKKIDRSVKSNIIREKIPVPKGLLTNIDGNIPLVTKEDVKWLINNRDSVIPARLEGIENILKKIIHHFENVKIANYTLSLKEARQAEIIDSLNKVRVEYNNSLRNNYKDSVLTDYRNKYINTYSLKVQQDTTRSIRIKNNSLLVSYNEHIIKIVNDSINKVIRSLSEYAANDSVLIRVTNTDGDIVQIWTDRNDPRATRFFIKNEQNDSLGIRIENAGKQSVRLFIDDGGVTLSRYKTAQSKDAKLVENKISYSNLENVFKKFKIESPWTLSGKTNFGLSQTGITKWKLGGESSFSFLFTFYGKADYVKDKVTWNNSFNLYDGWIKPGGERLQKNEDEIDLTSRIGYKAAKKWNYSAEVSFKSQLFNSYNYPNREDVISKFVSPVYVNLKLGMAFNPDKDLSLLMSPLSLKMIYINDSSEVDVTDYGIEEGKKTYWQPGFNLDLSWNKSFSDDISYSTKYNLFLNYMKPTNDIPDMDWQ